MIVFKVISSDKDTVTITAEKVENGVQKTATLTKADVDKYTKGQLKISIAGDTATQKISYAAMNPVLTEFTVSW
mgnify:CR=1 FL=1